MTSREDRIKIAESNIFYLAALLGTLQYKEIMEHDEFVKILTKAFNNHPDLDGYTAVLLEIDDIDFQSMQNTIATHWLQDNRKEGKIYTLPEILKGLINTGGLETMRYIARMLYTKTVPMYQGALKLN